MEGNLGGQVEVILYSGLSYVAYVGECGTALRNGSNTLHQGQGRGGLVARMKGLGRTDLRDIGDIFIAQHAIEVDAKLLRLQKPLN
jgi:hypothetical protein